MSLFVIGPSEAELELEQLQERYNNLATLAEDALAELTALVCGRGPYAGPRVVGPEAGRIADRLAAALDGG